MLSRAKIRSACASRRGATNHWRPAERHHASIARHTSLTYQVTTDLPHYLHNCADLTRLDSRGLSPAYFPIIPRLHAKMYVFNAWYLCTGRLCRLPVPASLCWLRWRDRATVATQFPFRYTVTPQTWNMLPSHFEDRNICHEQFKSGLKIW